MMTMKFTVNQTAAAMGMETSQLRSLMLQGRVQPQDDGLTLEQIQQLRQLQEEQGRSALRAQSCLERLVQKHTLLIDTCALLHQQFPLLAERLMPLLRQNCKALVVPSSVTAELRYLPLSKPELTERIQALLPLLAQLRQQGLLRVYGGQGETFGDRQMLSTVTTLLTTSSLLVITQDKGLSTDLLLLNQLDCMRDKQAVAVSRINRYGYLSRFQPQTPEHMGGQNTRADAEPAKDQTHAEESSVKTAPAGGWRLMWSSFTRCLKEELAAQRAEARSWESTRSTPAEPTAHRASVPAAWVPQGDSRSQGQDEERAPEHTQVVQRVRCADCGETFEITRGEYLYFQQHNLVLPKRCPACRRRRKMERADLACGA